MSARGAYLIAPPVGSTRLVYFPSLAPLSHPQLPTTHSFFMEKNS